MTSNTSQASHDGITGRIERVRSWLAGQGLDCLVAAGSMPVNHLLGYRRYFGGPAAAVVDAGGARALLVPHDEMEGAEALGVADCVHRYGARGFGLVPDQAPLLAKATAALREVRDAARIGVVSEVPGLKDLLQGLMQAPLIDAEDELTRIRLVKDPDEIERIRTAYELAWTAQEAVRATARPGMSEIALFTTGMASAQLAAGRPIEFVGDLLCGVRTADVCAPIRVAGGDLAADGDAVIADLVVGCDGYWGDTADTFVVGDSDHIADIHAELRSIRDRAAALLTPGRRATEIWEMMSACISESFPEGEFPHHGGHGVGLSSYEAPHIIPTDHARLEAGMVMALEPGVYFTGRFGVRVEGMYLVSLGGGKEIRALSGTGNQSRRMV